jgi:hypothetical protein
MRGITAVDTTSKAAVPAVASAGVRIAAVSDEEDKGADENSQRPLIGVVWTSEAAQSP